MLYQVGKSYTRQWWPGMSKQTCYQHWIRGWGGRRGRRRGCEFNNFCGWLDDKTWNLKYWHPYRFKQPLRKNMLNSWAVSLAQSIILLEHWKYLKCYYKQYFDWWIINHRQIRKSYFIIIITRQLFTKLNCSLWTKPRTWYAEAT